MYRKVEDFLKQWSYETEITGKLFQALTHESLTVKTYAEGRTLARLAWHIIASIPEMANQLGLQVTIIPEDKDEPDPESICASFKLVAGELTQEVKAKFTDSTLLQEHTLYGEAWADGTTLQILIQHQAHHRGQMTVLMRQAGLKIPGIYGPSKEEWAAFQMPAQP
ncbi:hypothetical protein BAC3_00107 [uncultured bacterium]|nr:hypothetical protein BAC3_00107 [uncultured bacterium]